MSQPIPLSLLAAVDILSKEGKYSRAAERLGITPDSLKTQIAALEERLGLHIFETQDDLVRVSQEGQTFITACDAFLTKQRK